jgi:MarR family transcriptional regulator, lower aerobic nicotinate degradation pathway regulator
MHTEPERMNAEPATERGHRRGRHPGVSVPGAPISSALLQTIRAHASAGAEMLAAIGLVPPQELILMRLAEQGDTPQSDLVYFLNRDRSTVSNTLQAMERAGLIVRRPSASDRRAIDVALTDKGREFVPQAQAIWAELERQTTALLAEADREPLLRGLAAIRESLRNRPDV